jgi:hypothetical protein
MHCLAVKRCVVGSILMLWSAVASGQDAASDAPSERAIDRLVVGDWYVIDVARDGVGQRFEGDFVKANDRWIVLRRISEGRNDVAAPSRIPFTKPKQTSNVHIGRQVEHLWIPREAALIKGRVLAANPPAAANISDESPPLGATCRVVVADGEKTTENGGDLAEMTDEKIVLDQEVTRYTKRAAPYVGELPFVGSVFRVVKGTDEHVREDIRRETVLCIRVTGAAGSEGVVAAASDQQNGEALQQSRVGRGSNGAVRR